MYTTKAAAEKKARSLNAIEAGMERQRNSSTTASKGNSNK